MNKKVLNTVIVAVVLIVCGYLAYALGIFSGILDNTSENDDLDNIVCTADAKMCPDGSYVGRTGPKCEFTECPGQADSEVKSIKLNAEIGEKVSGLQVSIKPLEVLEDSRCPLDVVCIQAGTVRLKAEIQSGLGTANQTFTLGQAITTEAEIITLISVTPPPISFVQIADGDYEFVFEVEER